MLEEAIKLTNKESVVQELKQGRPSTKRIYQVVLTAIHLSFLTGFIRALSAILFDKKMDSFIAIGIVFCITLIIFAIVYCIVLLIFRAFYRSNGGDSGKDFLERLFLLGLSGSIKASLVVVPAVVFASLFYRFFANSPISNLLILLLFFALIVIGIGSIIWLYFYIKSGLLELNNSVN